MSGWPRVTVCVVPRERFSHAVDTLDSIHANTTVPYALVYVDGGEPAAVRRAVNARQRARGFEVVRFQEYPSPNHARNLALRRCDTEYVCFVDNDVVVARGWLARMLDCADAERADIVGPTVLVGPLEAGRVHLTGGALSLTGAPGRRHVVEEHHNAWRRLDELTLRRQQCGVIEFHCMLVRRMLLDRLGRLDEALLSCAEHVDLCLAAHELGARIFVEPAARVSYIKTRTLSRDDRRYYRLRWSDDWNRRSLARLRDKWQLDPADPTLQGILRWCAVHRWEASRVHHLLAGLTSRERSRRLCWQLSALRYRQSHAAARG